MLLFVDETIEDLFAWLLTEENNLLSIFTTARLNSLIPIQQSPDAGCRAHVTHPSASATSGQGTNRTRDAATKRATSSKEHLTTIQHYRLLQTSRRAYRFIPGL